MNRSQRSSIYFVLPLMVISALFGAFIFNFFFSPFVLKSDEITGYKAEGFFRRVNNFSSKYTWDKTNTSLQASNEVGYHSQKPRLKVSYCTFNQTDRPDYGSREAEWFALQMKLPLSRYYDVEIKSCFPTLKFLQDYVPNSHIEPNEEWIQLGLDSDIRICFFGTTDIVNYMIERGGELVKRFLPPEVRKRWTGDFFLFWPEYYQYIINKNTKKRMGPMLVRLSSEPWVQGQSGVELQLETKRDRSVLYESSISLFFPFMVAHLGKRIPQKENQIDNIWSNYVGCCASLNESILDVTERRGFFDATQERKDKKGFAGFLQMHCFSNAISTAIRHSFVYTFHKLSKKTISLLGRCPTGANSTIKAGMSVESREALRSVVSKSSDSSVGLFHQYKFAIAFENSNVEGYMTEKIINAYISKSIPVYFGGGSSIFQSLNTNAFVHCQLPEDLELNDKLIKKLAGEKICPGVSLAESTPSSIRHSCYEAIEDFLAQLLEPSWSKCINHAIDLDTNNKKYESMLKESLLPNGGKLSGAWNMTHIAELLRVIYNVVVHDSNTYSYNQSSWEGKNDVFQVNNRPLFKNYF